MTVNRRRFHAFNRPWMWIAVFFLGLFWGGRLVTGYLSYQEEVFDEDVVLRFLDREMLFLDSGEKGNRFHDWWTGRSDLEIELSELESLIPEDDYVWQAWDGEYAITALKNRVASSRGEEVEPYKWLESWPRDEAREDLLELEYPAFMAKLYLSGGEDLEIRALYERQAATQLYRSYLIQGFDLLMLLGSLFVLRRAFLRPQKMLPRFPELWSPALLLTVFFATGIGATLFYDRLAMSLYLLPEGVYWPWTAADFMWRALPTFLMGLILFNSPKAMWRSFGLDRPVAWSCLLVAFGFSFIFNWVQYYAGGTGEVDPSDYFFYPDPELSDLFSGLLSGVIAAPIFEEAVFRGFLFLGLQKRIGVTGAAVISSLLFGVIHIQYDFWAIFNVTIFGFICTWLAWRTQSIKTGIIFHMIYNLLITIDVYLLYQMPLK